MVFKQKKTKNYNLHNLSKKFLKAIFTEHVIVLEMAPIKSILKYKI